MIELKSLIEDSKSLAIAFSGGCDSIFLAEAARRYLEKDKIILLLANFSFLSRSDFNRAVEFANKSDLNLEIIKLNPLQIDEIKSNSLNRCYYCKKMIFSSLKEFATSRGFLTLSDGTNLDDLKEFRPGLQAAKELDIKHLLVEAQYTKKQIREQSLQWGLDSWDLPSNACLATRIATNEIIDEPSLKLVEMAENTLHKLGFKSLRARKSANSLNLKFAKDEFNNALNNRSTIIEALKYLKLDAIDISML